nr:hypothetical protein [Tanacetum cinerariifolium]
AHPPRGRAGASAGLCSASRYCLGAAPGHARSHAARVEGSRPRAAAKYRNWAAGARRRAHYPPCGPVARNGPTSSQSGQVAWGLLGSQTLVGLWYVLGCTTLPALLMKNTFRGAGFAAGVGQLHARHAAVGFDKLVDALLKFDVFVLPDTEVFRRDATFGRHRRGFLNKQTGAAHGAAA